MKWTGLYILRRGAALVEKKNKTKYKKKRKSGLVTDKQNARAFHSWHADKQKTIFQW